MGANATTFVPAYVSGEVLTAADLTVTNSGIPVFATTVTRDAAFGGTGEKTLAEGQYAYIEATNTTQYYDGAAWQSVGITPGLTLVTAVTFTTAATVSMASGVFTSAYQNYLVLLTLTASSTNQTISLRVNNAGTPRTAASYSGGKFSTNSVSTTQATGSNNATSFNFGALAPTVPGGYAFTVLGPEVSTIYTSWSYTGMGLQNDFGAVAGTFGGGNYGTAETNDGLTFFVSGTISGNYRVYGYGDS